MLDSSLHVRLVRTGALGPETSVLTSNGADASPSFFHVNDFSEILYVVYGSGKSAVSVN